MAVVIRLQGLRISAGSEDIRNFFTGLRIPDGGVHIVGGELEEAFITFASDEDARRAMSRSGGCVKGSPVNLLLSSKSEMQRVLEESSRRSELKGRGIYKKGVKRPSVELGPSPDVHLKLTGMPFSATKENVRHFFEGLQLDNVLFVRNHRGTFIGQAIVRFITMEDAIEGLKRDRQYMGPRYIHVMRCSEEEWVKACRVVRPDSQNRQCLGRTRSQSSVSYRSRLRSPTYEEYCVLFKNLAYDIEKRDLRALLHPLLLKDNEIIIFTQQKNNGTKSAVVVFRNLTDYCAGLTHHKKTFMHKVLYVSPISKEKMVAMLESSVDARDVGKGLRRSVDMPQSQRMAPNSEIRCVYVRNLPFDVRKVEIMDFFHGFALSEDRVILLHDEKGAGLGEALVVFQSEKESVLAKSLNRQRFLGSEVMLKCITLAQMRDFGVNYYSMISPHGQINQRPRKVYNDGPPFSNTQMPPDDRNMQLDMYCGYGGDCFEPNFDHNNAFTPGPDDNGQHCYGSPDQQFDGVACI